jgi:hypothetical protein
MGIALRVTRMACDLLHAILNNCISSISGQKVVDNRMTVAAWSFLAVGAMVVLALAYVGAWVCWQKYTGTRHRRLEEEGESAAADDEEQHGAYVARGQQLQFLRDDGGN